MVSLGEMSGPFCHCFCTATIWCIWHASMLSNIGYWFINTLRNIDIRYVNRYLGAIEELPQRRSQRHSFNPCFKIHVMWLYGNSCWSSPDELYPIMHTARALFCVLVVWYWSMATISIRVVSQAMWKLRLPRIWCCHYLPPGSLITLGASQSLSYSHVSFNLI